MRILVFYFSGTGNTRKIAKEYAAAFSALNCEAELRSLPLDGEISSKELESADILGFGYPIHAFNAPEIVIKFVKKINKLNENKRAFIFKSSGEPVRMSDVSSLKLIKLLKARNIDVKNEYQYCMPYNIIFRHSDQMAYRMWETAKKLIPIDCDEIINTKPHGVRHMFMGGMLAWFLRIEHFGAHFNGIFYKTTKDCVNCGLCVKACPVKNITVDEKGEIHFGKNCLMCMRCTLNCPKNAIKAGLFNGWKVNGKYSFNEPSPTKQQYKDKHANYCKKAYNRYFADAEAKITAYKQSGKNYNHQ